MSRPHRPYRLLPLLLLAACGYFNAMYNAQRRFGDARRAERRGETAAAARAYLEAIEKAAASYRSHPDGRWADDALLLIGRAHFALENHAAARAAFEALLATGPDGGMRADAHAWLGAAEAALDNRVAAAAHLDTAIAAQPSPEAAELAHLWRARVRFAGGEDDAAWVDLERAAVGSERVAVDANLESAHRAITIGDTARVRRAVDWLLGERPAAQHADSIAGLVRLAANAFGPAFAHSMLESAGDSDWPADTREANLLMRVELSAEAGDTAAAVRDALDLADRATAATAGQARLLAARYEFARADSVAGLAAVRAVLLPATVTHQEARRLVRSIKAVEVLLERAVAGQPLALFAAAEIARDELHARRVARQLFIAYADIVPDAVWAPKALLAAVALPATAADPDPKPRLLESRDNVYVQAALAVADAESFSTAEQRLARTLGALREDAFREADARDIRVGSAIARLDSLKAIALADSMRLACGAFIDSLAIGGILADSVRAACVRGDTARVGAVLRMDTLMLKDTTKLRPDTGRAGPRRMRQDTFGPANR